MLTSPKEREIAIAVSDTARLLRTYADHVARDLGMTRSQWFMLSRIDRSLIGALIWLATAILFRYSSLAALVACVAAAAFAGFVVDGARAALIAAMALVIIARHHENIRRLIAGTESRISFKKS